MRGYTRAPAKPKRPIPPRLSDEARKKPMVVISPVLAALEKKFPKKKDRIYNWPIDVFIRWHRSTLYFVAS